MSSRNRSGRIHQSERSWIGNTSFAAKAKQSPGLQRVGQLAAIALASTSINFLCESWNSVSERRALAHELGFARAQSVGRPVMVETNEQKVSGSFSETEKDPNLP